MLWTTSKDISLSTAAKQQKRFKLRVVLHKIFKRFTSSKDSSINNNKNDSDKNPKSFLYLQEIEQNNANEMLLKACCHQPYIVAIETSVGIFFWDCAPLQKDDEGLSDIDFGTPAN